MHQCILFISWVNVFWQHTMFSWTLICSMTLPLTWFAAYFTEMHSLLMWFAWYNPGNVPYIMNCFGPSMSAKYANIEWSLPAQPISFAERKEFWSVLAGTPQLTLPLPATKQFMCFCSWNLYIYIIVINNPMLQSNSNFPGLYLALMECQFSTFGFISLFLVKDY